MWLILINYIDMICVVSISESSSHQVPSHVTWPKISASKESQFLLSSLDEDLLPKDTRARKGGKPWLWLSSKPWMHGGCSHVGMNPAGKPCSSGGPALEVRRKIEGISWWRILKDQEMWGDIRRYVEVFQDFWWNPRENPSCDGHSEHDHIDSMHHSALATYPSETWGAECRYPFSPDRGVQHASSVRNHIGATEAEESLIYPCNWKNNFQVQQRLRGNHAKLKMTITVNCINLQCFFATQDVQMLYTIMSHSGQCSSFFSILEQLLDHAFPTCRIAFLDTPRRWLKPQWAEQFVSCQGHVGPWTSVCQWRYTQMF